MIKKISYRETNETDVTNLMENYKELKKNSQIILNLKQKFKTERPNAFTENIDKIALS